MDTAKLLITASAVALAGAACSLDTEKFSFDREDGMGGTGTGATGGEGGSGADGGLGGSGGSCEPGTVTCADETTILTCSDDGVASETDCEGDTPFCDGGTCVVCIENDTRCAGDGGPDDVVETCSGEMWVQSEACPIGCNEGTCLDVVDLGAGPGHTCAVLSDGSVRCWGYNDIAILIVDELNDGPGVVGTFVTTPTVIPDIDDAIEVGGGDAHSCARTESGTLKCWGWNGIGQLGTGDIVDHPTPIEVPNVAGVTSMGVGIGHTCVTLTNGKVACWGLNDNGQIGNGTTDTTELSPVEIDLPFPAAAVSAGEEHTCARDSANDAYCWGDNGSGQVGDGTTTDVLSPFSVLGDGVEHIVAAGDVSFGIRGGDLYVWGRNSQAQLFLGATSVNEPNPVNTGIDMVTGAASGSSHSCMIRDAGDLYCVGRSDEGQVGNGSSGNGAVVIQPALINIDPVVDLAMGYYHTCALTNLGEVLCWGINFHGQLGDGTQTMRTLPTAVVW